MKFGDWEEGYIVGAVTRLEGHRLARLAGQVPDGQVIVELGSHGGSSTSWLAIGVAKANRSTRIFAVDPWDLDAGDRLAQHAESAVRRRFDAQLEFLASAGYIDPDVVHPIRGHSVDVADGWPHPVGLLHVDALHTYDAVTADLAAWCPHVAPGGVVVMHDWSNKRMGVRRAAADLAATPGWELLGTYRGDRRKGKHGQAILRRVP